MNTDRNTPGLGPMTDQRCAAGRQLVIEHEADTALGNWARPCSEPGVHPIIMVRDDESRDRLLLCTRHFGAMRGAMPMNLVDSEGNEGSRGDPCEHDWQWLDTETTAAGHWRATYRCTLCQACLGGLFRVPTGPWSPITRRPDGVLDLWDVSTGASAGQCPVGDWVIFGPDGFMSHHFDDLPPTGSRPRYQRPQPVDLQTPSITCPLCGMTSYNPKDIQEGYCGRCHDWTADDKPSGGGN